MISVVGKTVRGDPKSAEHTKTALAKTDARELIQVEVHRKPASGEVKASTQRVCKVRRGRATREDVVEANKKSRGLPKRENATT